MMTAASSGSGSSDSGLTAATPSEDDAAKLQKPSEKGVFQRLSHLCATFQFQRVVGQFFTEQGRIVAKWPLPFILVPLVVALSLTSGVFVHFDSLRNRNEERLGMFLPDTLPSIVNLKRLKTLFASNDLLRDRYDVFRAQTPHVIIVDNSDAKNVLRSSVLRSIVHIMTRVRNISVEAVWNRPTWDRLCLKSDGTCAQHPFLLLLEQGLSLSQLRPMLGYPTGKIEQTIVDNSWIFGGVRVFGNGTISAASAIRIPFLISMEPQNAFLVTQWQTEFLKAAGQMNYPGVSIYYSTPLSWSLEMDRNGKLIIPYLPLLVAVLIAFSVVCCMSRDNVLSKPWLGLIGSATAMLAVSSAIGMLLYLGYPFIQLVYIMPFLVTSISLDGMFLLLSSWKNTHPLVAVETRTSQCVGRAAVSIMITSITDGLSFSVGSISQFAAVRIFCTYCALAILFNFLYQMTFFVGCLVLSGRREAANRHCITFHKVVPKNEAVNHGRAYQLFCAGGYIGKKSKDMLPSMPVDTLSSDASFEDQHWLTAFLGSKYTSALCQGKVRVIVMLFYGAYLATAAWGIFGLQLGLDIKDLVPIDSYMARQLATADAHFTSYGGHAYAVLDSADIDYHLPETRAKLLGLYGDLTNSSYSSRGEFWLDEFVRWSGDAGIPDQPTEFLQRTNEFLRLPQFHKFAADISFHRDLSGIRASKMLIRLRNVGFANYSNIARTLKNILAASELPAFLYETLFILVEQQERNAQDVVQNMLVDVAVMVAVSVIFMPKLSSTFWIIVSIASINSGVIGFLALWGVRLDLICIICVVMAIGCSVNFVGHVTYHYMTSRAKQGKPRIHYTLHEVGLPLLQSTLSIVIGVSTLAFVPAYMVRTFVKSVVLVVCLGALHGLLFLPILLSLFVPNGDVLETFSSYQKARSYFSNTITSQFRRMHQLPTNLRLKSYFEKLTDFAAETLRRRPKLRNSRADTENESTKAIRNSGSNDGTCSLPSDRSETMSSFHDRSAEAASLAESLFSVLSSVDNHKPPTTAYPSLHRSAVANYFQQIKQFRQQQPPAMPSSDTLSPIYASADDAHSLPEPPPQLSYQASHDGPGYAEILPLPGAHDDHQIDSFQYRRNQTASTGTSFSQFSSSTFKSPPGEIEESIPDSLLQPSSDTESPTHSSQLPICSNIPSFTTELHQRLEAALTKKLIERGMARAQNVRQSGRAPQACKPPSFAEQPHLQPENHQQHKYANYWRQDLPVLRAPAMGVHVLPTSSSKKMTNFGSSEVVEIKLRNSNSHQRQPSVAAPPHQPYRGAARGVPVNSNYNRNVAEKNYARNPVGNFSTTTTDDSQKTFSTFKS